MLEGKSLMNKRKTNGPKMEPLGTSTVMFRNFNFRKGSGKMIC